MTDKEVKDIEKAKASGYRIQIYSRMGGKWIDTERIPCPNLVHMKFRVHPEDIDQWEFDKWLEADKIPQGTFPIGTLCAFLIVASFIYYMFFKH